MTDKTCQPPRSPNIAGPMPGVTPPPAGARTIQYDQCGGTADLPVGALAQQVALAPGQVVYTKKCPGDTEFDTVTLCDPVTGASILVVTTYSDAGVPTATAYNIDG